MHFSDAKKKNTRKRVIIALSFWGFACYKTILSWSNVIFDREFRDDSEKMTVNTKTIFQILYTLLAEFTYEIQPPFVEAYSLGTPIE